MVSINLPKKASLYDIVNKINSLKERSVGIDGNGGIEEVSSSESYDMVLPYDYYRGFAVVYNNEIHIMGSNTNHYKWDGSSWISVSTLPYEFYDGSAVVYNNEIHILGSYNNNTAHYKFDGSSWIEVGTLPYNFYWGSAVVYNNEIHILGGINSAKYHYKWDGSSWTSVSTLLYSFYYGDAVVYGNEIHIFGDYSGDDKKHYKWDGSSWTSVSTLPYSFYQGSAVVYNNEIHILGGNGGNTKHYKWDGSSWTSVSTLPYSFYYGSAVIYNNEIHILGSYDSSYYTAHYKWDGSSWTNINIITTLETFLKYYLPKDTQIYCDNATLTPNSQSTSLDLFSCGYTVSETGLVILDVPNDATEIQKTHSVIYGNAGKTDYDTLTKRYIEGTLTVAEGLQDGQDIGNYTFFKQPTFMAINLPQSIGSIGIAAFKESGLKGKLKLNCTEIREQAFQSCTGLTKVWISSLCTSIIAASYGNAPFLNCSDTIQIYAEASTAPEGWGSSYNSITSDTTIEFVFGTSESEFDAL